MLLREKWELAEIEERRKIQSKEREKMEFRLYIIGTIKLDLVFSHIYFALCSLYCDALIYCCIHTIILEAGSILKISFMHSLNRNLLTPNSVLFSMPNY